MIKSAELENSAYEFEAKMPLRRSVCPPLGWMGRHSLVLYLLHQPVILGVLTVAFRLVRAG